jgi:hypothetical protein
MAQRRTWETRKENDAGVDADYFRYMDVHMEDTVRDAYGPPGFILQHVVDAFAVQTANDESKPLSWGSV